MVVATGESLKLEDIRWLDYFLESCRGPTPQLPSSAIKRPQAAGGSLKSNSESSVPERVPGFFVARTPRESSGPAWAAWKRTPPQNWSTWLRSGVPRATTERLMGKAIPPSQSKKARRLAMLVHCGVMQGNGQNPAIGARGWFCQKN